MRIAPLLIAACTAPLAAQTPAPYWPVGRQPIVAIGTAARNLDLELDHVSSAHRLADGRLVVANGDPLELRVYSADGRFLRRMGRSGDGPGEFSRRVRVFGWPHDSVLAFTAGTKRWAIFTLDGRLAREWNDTLRNTPDDLLVFRHTFAVRGVDSPAACTRAAIDRIPAAGDSIRQVVPDAAGRYWVRGAAAPAWTVYTLAGKGIGRVALPPGSELLDIGSNAVVVKARDADDVERIEVWRVTMPAAAPPAADGCRGVADSAVHSAYGLVSAMMRTDLRNMQVAADAYRASHQSYPASIADFGVTFSGGGEHDVRLLLSNPAGWGAMMRDRNTGMYCIEFSGATVFPGWPSGTQSCALDADMP